VDCPYEAIRLEQRTDGHPDYTHIAVVKEARCVSCGICTGSCPLSAPLRHADHQTTGIDMPHRDIQHLYVATRKALAKLSEKKKILVYGCDHGADVCRLERPGVATVSLPCTGALPPSFITYALRNGVDGVFITGCRSGDCFHRLGNDWVDQRLACERKPYLKQSVSRARIRIFWAASSDHKQLGRELESFSQSIEKIPQVASKARGRSMVFSEGN
jgi:coenzyme F420-reducing hydrogenase delta subunit